MKKILFLWLLCTSTHAQGYRPDPDMLRRQQQTRAAALAMLKSLQAERHEAAHPTKPDFFKQERLQAAKKAEEEREKEKAEREKELIRQKSAAQPKPEVNEYEIWREKKEHGWLPDDPYTQWRTSPEYLLWKERQEKKPPAKAEEPKEDPEAQRKVILDILNDNLPKREEKKQEEVIEEEH